MTTRQSRELDRLSEAVLADERPALVGREGVRLELGDTVALTSDFHGLDQEEFTVRGKDLDLGGRGVSRWPRPGPGFVRGSSRNWR